MAQSDLVEVISDRHRLTTWVLIPPPLSVQDIIDLADASGVHTLREPAVRMTSVTAENADSWLDWLSKERGGNLEPIRRQVVQLQKDAFRKVFESMKWETLDDEKLCLLREIRHEKLQGV